MGTPTKMPFPVVYDYGTGGVWSIVRARSAAEIMAKYPELRVVDRRPAWMTDDYHRHIASERTFDIDDPPDGWLRTLVEAQHR
jgi:hypothetical protein